MTRSQSRRHSNRAIKDQMARCARMTIRARGWSEAPTTARVSANRDPVLVCRIVWERGGAPPALFEFPTREHTSYGRELRVQVLQATVSHSTITFVCR